MKKGVSLALDVYPVCWGSPKSQIACCEFKLDQISQNQRDPSQNSILELPESYELQDTSGGLDLS